MKKLITLTTLILIFTASIIAQDYTLGLPNKNRFENLYLFTKTNNNYIYLVLLEQHERGNKVLKEYKSLDKKTNTEKVHQLKNPILFQNPILNTFHYDKKLYFLNFKRDSKTIEISSLSLETEKLKSNLFRINLQKKEKIITSYYKDDIVFISTIDKKSKQLKVYKLSLLTKEVTDVSIVMNRYDLKEVNLAIDNKYPISLIDYDQYNSIFSFTNRLKIFVDKDEIVFTIEHTYIGLINVYKFDLSKKSTKTLSFKKPKIGINTINITYFQGQLYRVSADKYELRLEVTDIETEKSIVYEEGYKSNYPFDFQSSNLVDQDLNIIDNNKQVFHKIGNRMSFIYPEIEGDKISIYLGSVLNPHRHKEFVEGLIMMAGVAGSYYTGGGFIPFIIQLRNPIEEEKLKYVLMETNLGYDLNIEPKNDFNENVNSIILRQRKEILEAISETKMNNISIQKFDDKYYGVFFLENTKKVLLKVLEI